MRSLALLSLNLILLLTAATFATPAPAQEGPGGLINPQRDCQTIRTCNFGRGGSFRGCVSSYSCRVCRFVPTSCRGMGRRKTCRKLHCTWGGVG